MDQGMVILVDYRPMHQSQLAVAKFYEAKGMVVVALKFCLLTVYANGMKKI